jgi:gliding motility-associated-like protein
MGFYNDICSSLSACTENNIKANEPFCIMIEGRTLELLSISTSADTICFGDNASLTSQGIWGVPPYSYSWDNGGGSGQMVSVSPASKTMYSVTITDQCANTATGDVTVNPNKASVTIEATSTRLLSGSSVTFTAKSSNGGLSPSYQWKINGVNVGTNSATFTTNSLVNNDVVSCDMYGSDVCTAAIPSNLIKVSVYYTVNITHKMMYNEVDTLDGHIFDKEGVFQFQDSAIDGADSITIYTIIIVRSLCPKIVVPGFFTPNGDGNNDFLEIENISCYLKSTVFIFDRFGKLLVRYPGINMGWDGTYRGSAVPSTDYWYEVVLPETGERVTGHFLLKR